MAQSNTPIGQIVPRYLWLFCAPGLCYVALWCLIAISRYCYPFELEWMEGGMIAHAVRLLENQPIYTSPSLDFVPFFYTPGYPILLWLLSILTGSELSFELGRMISLCSTVGLMGLIYHTIKREQALHLKCSTSGHIYALLGVGIYAGLYRTSGAFYDLARPDALAALLTGVVIYLGRFHIHHQGALWASLFMSLAFFTKQTASVFYPAVGLYWLLQDRRSALTYLISTLVLCGGACYLLNIQSHGAFWSYIFEGHQGHVFYWKNILLRYWRDLIFLAPLTLAIPLLWFRQISPSRLLPTILFGWWLAAFGQRLLTLNYPPHMYYRELWYEALLSERLALLIPPILMLTIGLWLNQNLSPVLKNPRPQSMNMYWLWIYIAGVGASALNHSTQWAYANCFMPLALVCALSIPQMVKDLLSWHRSPNKTHALLLIFSIQWIAWIYAPQQQIPHEQDYRALKDFKEKILYFAQGHPILTPASPLLSYQLGLGQVSTHQMGIKDVAYRGGIQGASRVKTGASKDPKKREWALMISHEQNQIPWVEQGYFQAERFTYFGAQTLRAKTGFLTRPEILWLPRYHTTDRWLDGPRPVHAHFEVAQSWKALGWDSQGMSFGKKPKRINDLGREGDYAAVSSRTGIGSLSTQLHPPQNLPLDEHISISLLVSASISSTSQPKHQSHSQLQVSLHSAQGKLLAQTRIKHGLRRITLPLKWLKNHKSDDQMWPLKLTVSDQDRQAGLWFDDLRWQRALGAP